MSDLVMGNINFGLELEGIFLDPLRTLPLSGYHSGRFGGNYFKFEGDSSLHVEGSNLKTHVAAECISKHFNHPHFPRVYVQRLREYFCTTLGGFTGYSELREHMYFNDSCGLHVHFSVPDENLLGTIFYDFIKLLRESFFSGIDDSEFINDLAKRVIKERYYRGYAEELDKDNFYGGHGDEMNFSSYEHGNGLEWRSPVACGIQTWQEFEELVEILCNSILKALNGREREYNEVYKCAISMQ